MKTYGGGERVKAGFYGNPTAWTIVPFGKAGGVLPGGDEHRYVKLPALALLAAAPLMGGLFVVFLPVIGFAMVFWFAGAKGLDVIRRAAVTARELAWRKSG